MAILQDRSKRKPTGGRYSSGTARRKKQMGRLPGLTTVGEKRVHTVRTLGGNEKERLQRINKVNLMDPKKNKASVTDLKTVLDNPANRHFIRRNIMTKGAIIETPKGKAKITNRPSQEGFVNAVLVKE